MGPRRDILLDDIGNRVLVAGDYGFANGQQAVRQGVRGNVGLWLGEVWYDQSLGVDYQGKILIHAPNPIVVRSEIARAILTTPDVTQMKDAGLSIGADRKAAITFAAASTAGDVSGTVTP